MLLFCRLPVPAPSDVGDALTDRRWQLVVRKIDCVILMRVCQGTKWSSAVDSTRNLQKRKTIEVKLKPVLIFCTTVVCASIQFINFGYTIAMNLEMKYPFTVDVL